jgi:MarR family 2-MHQ and catechol resistance regulon transcriptional repressor
MASFEEEIKSSNFQSQQQKAMLNTVFTGSWFLNQHAAFLKTFGISPQQYNVLRILRGFGKKMPMTEIKHRMLDKTPNLTRLSDRLKQKGLVDRTRSDDDRRVVYLKLSESGYTFLAGIDEKWEKEDHPEFKLSVDEAKILNELLDKFRS